MLKINKLDSDACGVGRINGRPILVDGVLPEELLEINSLEKHQKYDIVTDYNLVVKSNDRVNAPCKYYGKCGGCNLQHASIKYQKQFRIDKVLNNLKYIAGVDATIDKYVESSCQYSYRNKMVFVVKDCHLGMYRIGTHEFVAIEECIICNNNISKAFAVVNNWLQEYKVAELNHVAIRSIDNNIAIVLIGMQKPKNIPKLIENLQKCITSNFQLVFNYNDAKKDLITNNMELLIGDNIEQEIYGIKYRISANSFVQVNSEVCQKLYDSVIDFAKGDNVINAYSGAGLLTAILAKKCKLVYAVEIVKNAHYNAEKLKQDNKINNMFNFCGKAEEVVPRILDDGASYTLVVDPPRSGVDNKLITVINESSNIDKIIYISCNSNSLAKNIKAMTNFKIEALQLYNMFPNTSHVETLVVLRRNKLT